MVFEGGEESTRNMGTWGKGSEESRIKRIPKKYFLHSNQTLENISEDLFTHQPYRREYVINSLIFHENIF